MRKLMLITSLLVATAAPASARADSTDGSTPEQTETRWYGYHVLEVDMASWLIASQHGWAGAAGLFLGAPVVHIAHGNPAKAIISFVLRGGAAVGAGWLAFTAHYEGLSCTDSGPSRCADFEDDVLPVAMAALFAAQIIDTVWVSKEEVERPRSVLTPTAGLTGGGAVIGLAGTF